MAGFLKENWKWIVFPVAIIVLALVAIVILGKGQDASPFQYGAH